MRALLDPSALQYSLWPYHSLWRSHPDLVVSQCLVQLVIWLMGAIQLSHSTLISHLIDNRRFYSDNTFEFEGSWGSDRDYGWNLSSCRWKLPYATCDLNIVLIPSAFTCILLLYQRSTNGTEHKTILSIIQHNQNQASPSQIAVCLETRNSPAQLVENLDSTIADRNEIG